jgi:hypothetical protein
VRKISAKEKKIALETLYKISQMGEGMRESVIDWSNIGKNAKAMAREAFREKCSKCGK